MSDRTRLSRRSILKAALGGLAVGATGHVSAATPAQVEGPFFPRHAQPDTDFDMSRIDGHDSAAKGEVIDIEGRVLDEAGDPVADALVDVWQANAAGKYAHERDTRDASVDHDFQGWAQLRTDADGRFRVRTIVPGPYPVEAGWSRPPHVHFKVALRGYHELTTQMYFADQPLNDIDRLLLAVPAADRAQLVVDFASPAEGGPRSGIFDIVLRKA